MAKDKIEALYGEKKSSKRFEELMKDNRSTEIAGMLRLTTKTISHVKVSYSSCSCKLFLYMSSSEFI